MANEDTTESSEKVDQPRVPQTPTGFMRFGREDWVKWINNFLNEEFCEPQVTMSHQEPYTALAGVFHELETKSQQDLFAEAVKILFETTPLIKQNARYFRSIIELLALLKPYKAKSLARRHLFTHTFSGMEDGNLNLHTLLLIANCKYELDEELLDFITRTAKETRDTGYLLSCLRAVSELGGAEYLKILEIMLPQVKAKQRSAILLARELGYILFRYGSRDFCEWYGRIGRAVATGNDFFDGFELLQGALKKLVFHSFNPFSMDPNSYNALVAAQLHAYDRRYTAKEVVKIARLHQEVGRDATVNALINIWTRIKTMGADEALPWYYIASPASSYKRLPCLVSSGPNPNSSISDQFFDDEEPILAEIFEAVKDAGYGVPERVGRMTA
jgi:hypothetical protein